MANVIEGDEKLPTLFLVEPDAPGVEVVDDPAYTHNYPHGHPTIRFTRRGAAGRRADRRRGQRRRRSSAPGSPRSGWASPRTASARCGGCSRRPPPGRSRASRAAAGSWTTRACRSRWPTRPPTPPSGRLLALQVARMVDAEADLKIDPRQGVDGQAVRQRGRLADCADRAVQIFGGRGYLRIERGGALPARAARRPHLGGHERDPAPDRGARARAPRGRSHHSLRWTSRGFCARPRSPWSAPASAPAATGHRRSSTSTRSASRARSGASTRGAARRHGQARACRRVADLPAPVDAVVVAIPAAARGRGRRAGRRHRLRRRGGVQRRVRRGGVGGRAPGAR